MVEADYSGVPVRSTGKRRLWPCADIKNSRSNVITRSERQSGSAGTNPHRRTESTNGEPQHPQTLQLAQNELVQAETAGFAGSLVAGVAHELNTPIGDQSSVASTLEKTREFEQDFAGGTLKKSGADQLSGWQVTASDLLDA